MLGQHFMERQVMGYPDPPFIPPAAAGPDWPPDGLAGSGENAHRLVSELTGGAPKPVSVDDAFGVVFSKLAKDPVNADLIGQLEGLRLAIVERLETQRAARLADLQVQHTETYSACRAALDKRDALQNKLNAQATHLNAAGERLSRARSSWMAARQRRPQNYPTWDEIEAWKGEVAQAQARVDSEEKAYNELMAQQADLARQLAEAAKELERVTAEEAALKARLEGKPYSGTGDFGLIRQPESD